MTDSPEHDEDVETAGRDVQRGVSRRTALGLAGLAGAGVGGAVAAGAVAAHRSVGDASLGSVVLTRPQDLTPSQQQRAATNIGTVTVVEPEQFPGSSDDARLSAAFDALRADGGVIRLRPGTTYHWAAAVPAIDWAAHAPVVISAWGAVVLYDGEGAAFTSTQSASPAGVRTLTVLGGEWSAPKADSFFRLQDCCSTLFYRCRGTVPHGAMFHLSNVRFWSERNHFVEIDDVNCREVLRFSVDGSRHASFARTTVRDLRVQGGRSGWAKINVVESPEITPAVYDSTFDGVAGNVAGGVVVQRLAGAMSGTRMSRFQVEAADGSGGSYWDVGALTGPRPQLTDGPPSVHNMGIFTPRSAGGPGSFASPWLPAGAAFGAATTTTQTVVVHDSAGPVTINPSQSCVATVELSADCTAAGLTGSPSAPDGVPGSYTQHFTLIWVQDSVGGHHYVWPSTCRFAAGRAPVDRTPLTQTSVTFVYRSGAWLEIARAVAVPV